MKITLMTVDPEGKLGEFDVEVKWFNNCPLMMVLQIFEDLYPHVEYELEWANPNDIGGFYGLTTVTAEGKILVQIGNQHNLYFAVDILAHELAHAATHESHPDNDPHFHSPEWVAAYEAIHAEYTKRAGGE